MFLTPLKYHNPQPSDSTGGTDTPSADASSAFAKPINELASCKSSLSQPTWSIGARPLVSLAILLIITTILFLFTMSRTMPFEGDQPAKAAQILVISQTNSFFNLASAPDLYRPQLFSFYYISSAVIYKLVGGDLFTFMNLGAVFMGILGVVSLAFALRKAFGVNPLLSGFILLSMPMVVLTFTYGNEVAWMLGLFSLSMAFLVAGRTWMYYAAAPLLVLAAYSRVDGMLLVPFWMGWAACHGRSSTGLVQNWRRLVLLCVLAAICGAVYWIVFLRSIPTTHTSFTWDANLKFIISILSFPFCPTIALLGSIGCCYLLFKETRYGLVHLLLAIPVLFYATNLGSPKYIITLVLFFGIPAAVLMSRARVRGRAVMVALVMFWWIFSISPAGLLGPKRGAYWYLPTLDGPCPTGAYLSFYNNVRKGIYQVKQVETVTLGQDIYQYLLQSRQEPIIFGHKGHQALSLAEVQDGVYGERWRSYKAGVFDELQPGSQQIIMARTGYFYARLLTTQAEAQLRDWLSRGKIRGIGKDGTPFPSLVEIGYAVEDGTDVDLGRRILFMIDLYGGQAVFSASQFIEPYAPTSWVPSERAAAIDDEPVYRDAYFCAYEQQIDDALLYALPWPKAYDRFRHPKTDKVRSDPKAAGDH